MRHPLVHVPDPALDLLLERTADVPRDLVFKAWTTPDLLKQWFAPAPWTTPECELDLRPGGIVRTVMQSPDGQRFPNVGCCLEVIENRRFAWTSVLGPGFRPVPSAGDGFGFSAIISLEDHEGGTKYTALVRHGDPISRQRHEDMGFHVGWRTCFDQLVTLVGSGVR